MDYKNIIPNRELRMKILELTGFIPDKYMIMLQYWIKTGRKLNLKNPKRFTEKLQWYKLYYRDELMIKCVDKYDVRDYVKSIGLEHILLKCYGVYERVEDINFSELPDKFVLKDTLGAGGNSVIICKNKKELDIPAVIKQMKSWISKKSDKKTGGREWQYYSGKKHRIIVEEYLESDQLSGGLIDYKILCFNGKPACVYVLSDRKIGEGAQCGIFDVDFNKLPYTENDEQPLKRIVPKPENYDELINYAKILSRSFPEARIDLYNQNGKIYFGEITFFDGSGYMIFEPDEFDFILGEKFKLPSIKK